MSPSKFNVVPKDIEGVLMVLDNFEERLQNIEDSHKEIKDLVAKIDKKLWSIFISVIVAVGAKYGLDLSGIAGG